jgi:hypothetical protein
MTKVKEYKRWGALLLTVFFAGPLLGQEKLSGWVIDQQSKQALKGVHAINKRTLKGTITGPEGYFELSLAYGDTIVFSNIAYKYYYFVYQDSATALEEVIVPLEEQNYLLDEVSVFAYELTSNKPREIPLKKPRRPDEKELPQDQPVEATVANPAEYLYNLFGSKPRQLRKLAQLQKEDAYRKKLRESNNRQRVMELTGLKRSELEAFMFYCKYSPVRMRRMNDYEYLRSVRRCYALYVKDRELDRFLQQWD